MTTQHTDMMIYYKPSGKVESGLSDSIRNKSGVISAEDNPYVKHLINIAYDPVQTSGRHILEVVREKGLPAWMIGM